MCDGELDDAQIIHLNSLLANSDKNRTYYLDFMDMHASIINTPILLQNTEAIATDDDQWVGILSEAIAIDESAKIQQHIENEKNATIIRQREEVRKEIANRYLEHEDEKKKIYHFVIIPRAALYTAAAAVIALCLMMLNTLLTNDNKTQFPLDITQISQPVATISKLVNAEFDDSRQVSQVGARLKPGHHSIAQGLMKLIFDNKAELTISGPASFEIISEKQIILIAGKVVGYCPEGAQGFIVRTPSTQIVDLGTEFGITVNARQESEIHVFDGAVEISTGRLHEKLEAQGKIFAGKAKRVNAYASHVLDVKINVKPFIYAAPHLGLLYNNLIKNGDFEANKQDYKFSSKNPLEYNIKIKSWDDNTNATVIHYDHGSLHYLPDPNKHTVPDNRGQFYFAGIETGYISQHILVDQLKEYIDREEIVYNLSAWLGGFLDHKDNTLVHLYFLDRNMQPLSDYALEKYQPSDRNNETKFKYHESPRNQTIPKGTRWIELRLETMRHEGLSDDFVDNIKLELSIIK